MQLQVVLQLWNLGIYDRLSSGRMASGLCGHAPLQRKLIPKRLLSISFSYLNLVLSPQVSGQPCLEWYGWVYEGGKTLYSLSGISKSKLGSNSTELEVNCRTGGTWMVIILLLPLQGPAPTSTGRTKILALKFVKGT